VEPVGAERRPFAIRLQHEVPLGRLEEDLEAIRSDGLHRFAVGIEEGWEARSAAEGRASTREAESEGEQELARGRRDVSAGPHGRGWLTYEWLKARRCGRSAPQAGGESDEREDRRQRRSRNRGGRASQRSSFNMRLMRAISTRWSESTCEAIW